MFYSTGRWTELYQLFKQFTLLGGKLVCLPSWTHSPKSIIFYRGQEGWVYFWHLLSAYHFYKHYLKILNTP